MQNILTVKSVYGDICRVAKSDYDNPARTQLPLYTSRGNRFIDTALGRTALRKGKCVSIHRGNIVEVVNKEDVK